MGIDAMEWEKAAEGNEAGAVRYAVEIVMCVRDDPSSCESRMEIGQKGNESLELNKSAGISTKANISGNQMMSVRIGLFQAFYKVSSIVLQNDTLALEKCVELMVREGCLLQAESTQLS